MRALSMPPSMTKPLSSGEIATLSDILLSRARTDADRVVFAERDHSLTYRQLLDDAGGLAAGLVDAGIRSGDRVAISMSAGLDFVRSFWALQLLGAISCALNPSAPASTIVQRALRVRPAMMLTDSDDVAREAARCGVRCLTFALIPRVARSYARHDRTSEDVAVFQPTSGTSGESRTAMIRHRNIFASLSGGVAALGFSPDDIFVAWVPPWHDLGLVRFIAGTPYFGARTHIVQPAIQTIPEWFQTMSRERATITGAPDFAWRLALRFVDPATVDLSSLRDVTNGGEPVRLSTITAFEEAFGLKGAMLPGYGLAEATLGVTCLLPGEAIRTDSHGNVSCGRALPAVELRCDEQTGEVLVRGDLVFSGYFDAEDATREALRDGWLHTGDAGHLDSDGHLYILGRRRAMLKRGGAVLAPRELEEAAQRIDGVRIAAAIGLATESSTEQIVMAIEVDPKYYASTVAREVGRSIRDVVGFEPDRVIVLRKGTIPMTYNGKLRHAVLREALSDGTLERAGAILMS
jgi:acyl-CoA synthetase (AMP-forming)/AMP-acid ligase II